MREGVRDIVFGIAMLAAAALLFLETTSPAYQQAGVLGYGFSPAFFPRILLIIWAALSIILIIRALPALHRQIDKPDWGKLAGAVAITLGYVGLIAVIGFAFASIVFAAAFMTFLGYRRVVPVALVALIFPLVTWYVFTFLLHISLPTSPWFNRL